MHIKYLFTDYIDASSHISHRASLHKVLVLILSMAIVVVGVIIFPPFPETHGFKDYLPLHTALETVAVVIASLVFSIGWSTYSNKTSGNILFIASIFLGVALLDFTHILSYSGMPDFITPGSPEKSIDFWLSARFLSAIGLLSFVALRFSPFTSVYHRYFLLGSVILFVLMIHWVLLFHDDLMPTMYVPGKGLTPYKIAAEYTIIIFNLITAFIVWKKMKDPHTYHITALFGALCIMAMSEFLFTLYANVSDFYNILGHIYKSIAYLFIYRSIFVTTVEEPYNELEESQNSLQEKTTLLDTIIENIPNMIFLKDAKELRFVLFNKAGERLLGYDRQELIGKNDYDFFHRMKPIILLHKIDILSQILSKSP